MDIYYHLLTAWGFLQAGGYSGWDFWEYAPLGRPHIYPPFFHLILAGLIKLGISKVILAKLFEVLLPPIFLVVLWRFLRKNYNTRLAFFVLLFCGSSYSFYLSLLNHLPATIALILGILAYGQFLKNNYLRSLLFLVLSFYTHIGIAWFLLFALLFWGCFEGKYRITSWALFLGTLLLSSPFLGKQLITLKSISRAGFILSERYLSQIKPLDCLLAISALVLIIKNKKYYLFLSLFLASLIFLLYPYRFFSAEGYFPLLLLAAVFLENLSEKIKSRYLLIPLASLILVVSPTLSLERPKGQGNIALRLDFFDSAFLGMLLARIENPRYPNTWYANEYITAAVLVKNNSQESDIVYSTLNIPGMAIASIAGRATANALLPEIRPAKDLDPFSVSKIIIFAQDDPRETINRLVTTHRLLKIGENKMFVVYRNPTCPY